MCLILYFMWFWGKNRSFLRSGGDKRVKVWRNGLRPLKEVKRSSQISPKGKKRVVAKPCRKATTRRSTIGVQNKSDESSLGCHDSSHIYWFMQSNPETKRRVVPNLPRLVTNPLKSCTQAETKRRLVAPDVTSRRLRVKCFSCAFFSYFLGNTINRGSYFLSSVSFYFYF